MPQVAYVNGAYLDSRLAAVHYEDRGYQFSDGVYEVILIRDGHLIDAEPHLARLIRSLDAIEIDAPCSMNALGCIVDEVRRRNRVHNGLVYMQVTRGAAPRDHVFPKAAKPTLVCTAKRRNWPKPGGAPRGVSAITTPDDRWGRCDIKSVGLLANVLAKEKAKKAGAGEALFVSEDGVVREGGSSNLYIVDDEGIVWTHPLGPEILGGVTRATVLNLAEKAQIRVRQEPFDVKTLLSAKEAFVTSATSFVKPITEVDGAKIGDGDVGPVAKRLYAEYEQYTLEEPVH